MLQNHMELIQEGRPRALLTWHMPREDGHFHTIAFQFAEEVTAEEVEKILEIARRPLKLPQKQGKPVLLGSSDHFVALARPLSRLGYRTRYFGAAQREHVLQDRPIIAP